MRKSTRIFKRYLATFLVVLMSIESFAAVVGDNDGAAFITKAEFDSMKNDFQSQLDRYNSSIDNKIDGAIASYISGIKIAKESRKSLICKDWENYTMINGILGNDLAFPDFNANIALVKMQQNRANYTGDDVIHGLPYGDPRLNSWTKLLWCRASLKYTNTRNLNRLCLVENVILKNDNTIDDTKITWAGIANRVRETWTCSGIADYSLNVGQPFSPVSSDPSGMRNDRNNLFIFCTPLNLYLNGYVSSYLDTDNPLWFPTVLWVQDDDYKYPWGTPHWTAISVIPTVDYEPGPTGSSIDYKHIGSWQGDNEWEVSVKNCVNYVRPAQRSTKSVADWFSDVPSTAFEGAWAGAEVGVGHQAANGEYSQNITAWKQYEPVNWTNKTNQTTANNHKIPTLGLLPTTYKANQIYQYYDDLKDDEGNLVPNQKLNNGMPLCLVEEGEVVSWDAVFSKCQVDGYTTEQEVKLVLSYGPFENGTNVNNANNYVNIDGFITGSTFPITTDKKCKIKFTADRKGYVYIKWYPNLTSNTDIDDRGWEVTLDIENCNTYVSSK